MGDAEDCIDLPPGFRFHPTDEEIITHYLSPKVLDHNFSSAAIGDVDFNKCEPWDLPSKAKMGEKEWYFFCQRDRKYPTGTRTNRATEAGYWKATGKDKEIMRGKGVLVGMKKTLVFYKGRAPKGEKTNWVMHEFRLEGKSHHFNFPSTAKDEWAVCKVFHKTMGFIKTTPMPAIASMNSFDNNLLNSPTLPPLMDTPYFNHNIRHGSSYVDHSGEALNFKGFSSMPSNFSTMVGMENKKDDAKSFLYSNNLSGIHRQLQSSMFHPQTPSANYYQLAGPTNMGYLHPASTRALAMTNDGSFSMGHCKVEPLSSRSMLSFSQETAQSTDRNTEISSVASKHEMGYNDIDDLLSAGQGLNLENMWKC